MHKVLGFLEAPMDVPFALSVPPVINLSKWGTWWHTGSHALPEKQGGGGHRAG